MVARLIQIAEGLRLLGILAFAPTIALAPASADTIVVPPGNRLQFAVMRAKPGDRIELQDGVYTGGVNLDGKTGITIAAQHPSKPILQGGQIIVSGVDCTLQGFQVVGVRTSWDTGAVLVTGRGNRLLDLDIHDNESLGIDISGGDATLIEGIKSNHNGNLGLNTGSPHEGNDVEGLTIRKSEFKDNNYGMADPVWKGIEGKTVFGTDKLWYRGAGDAAGGVKICNAHDVLIEDVEISGNTGAGLWFDVYCGKKTVRRVKVHGQKSIPGDPKYFAVGIEVELEKDGITLIEDCLSYDNEGSEYAVFEASNVTIRNCIAGGDIEFRDLGGGREQFRPRNILLQNVKLTGKVHYPNSRTRDQVTLMDVEENVEGLPMQMPAPADAAGVTGAVEPLRYPGKEMRDGLVRSGKEIEARIQAGSSNAADYVGLADIQVFLWCYGFAVHAEVMPRCEVAARRALELDPNLAAAHTALGVVLLGQRDWDAAERELRLATELDPRRAEAHHWYALYLAAMNRHDEAAKHSMRSFELDPSAGMSIGRSSILYFKRDWPGMLEVLKPTMEKDPGYGPAYDWLGMAYVEQRQFEKAIPTYRRAAELSDGLAEVLGGLGHAYAVAGREAEARQVLGTLKRLSERWHVPPVQIAFVHIGLGEKRQALDLLEQAYEQRSWELVFMQVEPWLDDLRAEPRFVELVGKMKFPK